MTQRGARILGGALLIAAASAAPLLAASAVPGATPSPGVATTTPAAPAIPVEEALRTALRDNGFTVQPNGTLAYSKDGVERTIPIEALRRAGLEYADGKLVRSRTGNPLEGDALLRTLRGLLGFATIQRIDPAVAGRTLSELGLPMEIDGKRLVNPDGTATYFGLGVYYGLTRTDSETPASREVLERRLAGLSSRSLSEAVQGLDRAYTLAFGGDASDPQAANSELLGSYQVLARVERREGEAALTLVPRPDFQGSLDRYRGKMLSDAGAAAWSLDFAGAAQSAYALSSLHQLSQTRYHADRDIPAPPRPGVPSVSPFADPTAPLHRSLPNLLSRLGPLTPAQRDALIASFPMGQIVLDSRAHEFWARGQLGTNVRVAVVDTAASRVAELDGVLTNGGNFTRQLDPSGRHATHVASTIHAIAPAARITSYAALDDDSLLSRDGPRSTPVDEVNNAVIRAIDRAVADGNRIVNLSLGGPGSLTGPLAEAVQRHSASGVVFVVSAGNNGRGGAQPIGTPASAPAAITVGALDNHGQVAIFSSHGPTVNPEDGSQVYRPILHAPGQNVVAAVPPMFGKISGSHRFESMSGTSMAAPHVSGTAALLWDTVSTANAGLNPLQMSRRVSDALWGSARPLPQAALPRDASSRQSFVRMDPAAAYRWLVDHPATP